MFYDIFYVFFQESSNLGFFFYIIIECNFLNCPVPSCKINRCSKYSIISYITGYRLNNLAICINRIGCFLVTNGCFNRYISICFSAFCYNRNCNSFSFIQKDILISIDGMNIIGLVSYLNNALAIHGFLFVIFCTTFFT